MTKISDMARITVAGRSRPAPSSADPIPERAWLAWTAARERALASGVTPEPDGSILWTGNLRAEIRALFPEVAWEDRQSREDFSLPIYSFLNSSGTARTVQRAVNGDPTQNTWMLAAEFDKGSVSKRSVKQYVLSRTERRLTAAEAGEDRDPAPVVSKVKPKAKKTGGGTGMNHVVVLPDGRLRCPKCPMLLKSASSLGGHMNKHNKSQRRPMTCPSCGANFDSVMGLGGHMKVHYNAERRAAAAAATLAAPIVETKAPLPPVALKAQQKNKAPKQSAITAVSTLPGSPTVEYSQPGGVDQAVAALVAALTAQSAANAANLVAENAALKAQIAKIRDAFAVA